MTIREAKLIIKKSLLYKHMNDYPKSDLYKALMIAVGCMEVVNEREVKEWAVKRDMIGMDMCVDACEDTHKDTNDSMT